MISLKWHISSWHLRAQSKNLGIHHHQIHLCSCQKRSGVSATGWNSSLGGSHRSLLVSQNMMDMHQSIANYFGPFLPFTPCDFWISHLEKTSKWHWLKMYNYSQHTFSVHAKCLVFFFFLLLVLYLAINTPGQIKHLQTFQKEVFLPLLRSVRSKDPSKISYAKPCVWLFCVCVKMFS